MERYRECIEHNHRFRTLEVPIPFKKTVIKRDGTLDTFDYNKIIDSIRYACAKLSIPFESQLSVFNGVIQELTRELNEKEVVNSRRIGYIIAKYLEELDKIAHLRYVTYFYDDVQAIEDAIERWRIKERKE